MPRKILQTLAKGEVYDFPAGAQSSGTVNITFSNDAGPHDQATITVTTDDGAQHRRDKLAAGTTYLARVGTYTDIASIRNIGPSKVQVSLDW